MKTFLLVASLLVMAYAADPEKLKVFYEKYDECRKEIDALKTDRRDARIIECIDIKENLFDENNKLNKEKALAYIDAIIIPGTEKQMRDIVQECLKLGDTRDQMLSVIECCLEKNIMDLLEKLE